MADVLIVYGSRHGQTDKIAQRMAEVLRVRGHWVELANVERARGPHDLGRFRVVLVGAPMYASRYLPSVTRFVSRNRELLQRVTSAFFSVNLAIASRTSDGRAETQRVLDNLIERSGWRPARVEFFAGALAYSRYNFLIRYVMRRIARKAGGDADTSRDYEYTDWSRVERFALDAVEGAAVTAAPDAPDTRQGDRGRDDTIRTPGPAPSA